MQIPFYKYHGAGNDFILFDKVKVLDYLFKDQIAELCHRHFGIGSDGLIVLEAKSRKDLIMHYFNPDGGSGMMCGNGARCAIKLANDLSLIDSKLILTSSKNTYPSEILNDGQIKISFPDFTEVKKTKQGFFINNGSPHVVIQVDKFDRSILLEKGRSIRYHKDYTPQGTNVNFIGVTNSNTLDLLTYERGVEGFTLACGTGAVAAAAAWASMNERVGAQLTELKNDGGLLRVTFSRSANNEFSNVALIGPAQFVFKGKIEL